MRDRCTVSPKSNEWTKREMMCSGLKTSHNYLVITNPANKCPVQHRFLFVVTPQCLADNLPSLCSTSIIQREKNRMRYVTESIHFHLERSLYSTKGFSSRQLWCLSAITNRKFHWQCMQVCVLGPIRFITFWNSGSWKSPSNSDRLHLRQANIVSQMVQQSLFSHTRMNQRDFQFL